MKNIFFVLILIFLCNKLSAQLSIQIQELNISNIDIVLNDNVINEDLSDGPYFEFVCSFENVSDTSITLHSSISSTNVTFNYRGKKYSKELISIPFLDKNAFKILPNQNIRISFWTHLLLGTPIYNEKQGNYTKEMLEILPTLKVNYRDTIFNVQASEVINVNIHN